MSKADLLRLRAFRPQDAESVLEVVRACYMQYDQEIEIETLDSDLLTIPETYSPPKAAFWVLSDGNRIVGTAAVLGGERREATLRRVFLLPPYRGRGHGKRLVLRATKWARDRRYYRLRFWSDELYTDAHAFYRHLGARETGARRHLGGRNDVWEREFVWDI